MRVAFLQEEIRDRFGIMYLSAALKQAGHECDVFVENPNMINEVLDYSPGIVGFSTQTAGLDFALRYAKEIKRRKPDQFIVMGGAHPTFYPEAAECIDAICRGEGEGAIVDLANGKKGIPNIDLPVRPLVDLDDLPMPDRALYFDKYPALRDNPMKRFHIIRGCPFSCTFCFNHALKKIYQGDKYVRHLSVDKAIDEILYVKETYGMKWAQLLSDMMNIDREWFMRFLDEYKAKVKVPFLCNVRISHVDEEMVRAMKDAGCSRVDYGIEHGDEFIRNTVLKKHISNKTIIENGLLFKKYGIPVQTTNIIGTPYETIDTAMKTVWINQMVDSEWPQVFVLRPYPGTQIYEFAKKEGLISSFATKGTAFQFGFDGSPDDVSLNLPRSRELLNLTYFFGFLVKHPKWNRIVRLLIKLPPNGLFRAVSIYPVVKRTIKYGTWQERRMALWVLLKTAFA